MLLISILLLVFVSDSLACVPNLKELKEAFKDCEYCQDCVKRNDLTANSSDKIDNVSLASFQIRVFNFKLKLIFSIPGWLAMVT